MLETHHPQAAPAIVPTAVILLSVPNSPLIPDCQPLISDALPPLYVSQGRPTSEEASAIAMAPAVM